ncbi:hypothetical protein B0H99_10344 [Planomicrobium soli]|uniref:Uncharacterized protein n=1 Tax=Planomicrobium soli TaxID=1176648 RepID=A0A2P8H3W5_9BACL|nr:hypothetical protein [Planomicrobium soli]PSL40912.1 hypothetical protein B0H99_10344 [Planomicrobium soli]
MHPVFLGIILFSLLVSSLICLWIIKTKVSKWTRILVAFSVNALILSIASAFLYKLDVQTFHKQTEGLFDSMGIGTLVFFVPINTFITILVMEFIKNKRERTGNERPI